MTALHDVLLHGRRTEHGFTKAAVTAFLQRELAEAEKGAYSGTDWSLQGLGMLRCYLGKKHRLHVWDDRYRVPNVTMLHDHPWDFVSLVVAGQVEQYRYVKSAFGEHEVMVQPIVCGPGGGVCEDAYPATLQQLPREVLTPGDVYTQKADEIHESLPLNGSVTIIERTFHANTEVAHVYYPATAASWVSAEPGPAHADTVADILGYALETWFR